MSKFKMAKLAFTVEVIAVMSYVLFCTNCMWYQYFGAFFALIVANALGNLMCYYTFFTNED